MKKIYTLIPALILHVSIVQGQKIEDSRSTGKYYHSESVRTPDLLINEENNDRSPDSVLFQLYDVPSGKWVNNFKTALSYDFNGNNTSSYVYYWNDTLSQWYYMYRNMQSYDSQNRRIYFEYSDYDLNTGQWVYNWKLVSSYSDTSGITLYYSWNNDEGSWMLEQKNEKEFNQDNMIAIITTCELNTFDSTWINNHKELFEYDSEGHTTLDYHFDWDQNSGQWKESAKYELSYDTDGNLVQRQTSLIDLVTHNLVMKYRTYFVYNEENKQIQAFSIRLDQLSGTWINDSKSETSYINDTLIETQEYTYIQEQWIKSGCYQSIEKDNYSFIMYCTYQGDERVPQYRYYNYYPGIILGNEDPCISDGRLFLYPNPVSAELTINVDCNQKEVYVTMINLQGKTVLNKNIRNGSAISMALFQKGLYICKVKVNGKIYTDKILVK